MRRALTLIVALMLLPACGGDEPLTVKDASEISGEVTVQGRLFVLEDGSIVIADLVAESHPPQPAGTTITVEGLDLGDLQLLQAPADSELATTQWSDDPIPLVGTMVDGVLTDARLQG